MTDGRNAVYVNPERPCSCAVARAPAHWLRCRRRGSTPGAAGTIAIAQIAHARPDGYTIALGPSPSCQNAQSEIGISRFKLAARVTLLLR
jgi:hypothetical protein